MHEIVAEAVGNNLVVYGVLGKYILERTTH